MGPAACQSFLHSGSGLHRDIDVKFLWGAGRRVQSPVQEPPGFRYAERLAPHPVVVRVRATAFGVTTATRRGVLRRRDRRLHAVRFEYRRPDPLCELRRPGAGPRTIRLSVEPTELSPSSIRPLGTDLELSGPLPGLDGSGPSSGERVSPDRPTVRRPARLRVAVRRPDAPPANGGSPIGTRPWNDRSIILNYRLSF